MPENGRWDLTWRLKCKSMLKRARIYREGLKRKKKITEGMFRFAPFFRSWWGALNSWFGLRQFIWRSEHIMSFVPRRFQTGFSFIKLIHCFNPNPANAENMVSS